MSHDSSHPSQREQNQFPGLYELSEALPQGRQQDYVNITGALREEPTPKDLFNAEIEELAKTQHKKHTDSMHAFSNVADGFHILTGPTATGKSENMVRSIWPLVRVGHKSCVTTVTNVASDTTTMRIFQARPEDLKDRKVLKIGTNMLEDVMMRKSDRYSKISEEKLAQLPAEDSSDDDSEDDPLVRVAEEELNTLFDKLEEEMEDMDDAGKEATQIRIGELAESFVEQKEARRKAFLDLRKLSALDRSPNVPLACTLSYQIWELMREDSLNAHASYERELTELKHEYQGEELHEHIAAMDSKFSRDQNPSRRFQEFRENYVKHNGQLPQASKDEFKGLIREMAKRVIANVWVLVTTANNAGGEVADLGFDPTLLWCDEAGQLTLPKFFIPLTVFKNWQGVIIIGDKKREPTTYSEGFNEVYENTKLSALAYLLEKGHPHFELVEQYRMDPDISAFPSKFWYEGTIENGRNTMVKDDTKDIMRTMSSERLGIAKKSEKGSVYWLESVFHGVCRHEEGGSSLQNYANADAICDRVKQLIEHGIRPEQITILVYYKSQIDVIAEKLKTSDGQKLHIKIVTADSFANGDQDIIVADFLSVKSYLAGSADKLSALDTDELVGEAETSAETLDSKNSQVFNKVSRYMRNAHRLYILLTTARKGLIIFCHLPTLLSTTKLNKAKKETSALAALAKDAIERDLVFTQTTAIDSHPEAAKMSQTNREKYEREQKHAKIINDVAHNRWNPYAGDEKRKMHQTG